MHRGSSGRGRNRGSEPTGLALSVLLMVLVLGSASANAESSVWRVSGRSGELFLAGSVHVLRKSDYPLPPEFEAAYARSERLILEADLGAMATPAMQSLMLSLGRYPDGGTLKEHLPNKTYRELSRFCRDRGLSLANLERFKPWMVVIALTFAELQDQGFDPAAGLDNFFYQRAVKDGKPVSGLETPREHIELLTSFESAVQGALITNFIGEMRTLPRILDGMVAAWRSGDVKTLELLVAEGMRRDAPELYRALVVERNQRWLESIQRRLSEGQTAMVIVGAAHLVGDDGLLRVLKDGGYTVSPLSLK